MDSGLTIRPTATVAQAAPLPPEPAPVPTAAPTTLPPAQSVTPSADSQRSAAFDPARDPFQQATTREVFIDPQTREMIFRVSDARTGMTVYQVPDPAQLQLQAYIRTVLAKEETPHQGANTDRAV